MRKYVCCGDSDVDAHVCERREVWEAMLPSAMGLIGAATPDTCVSFSDISVVAIVSNIRDLDAILSAF